MTDNARMIDYLKGGGKLTAPDNTPPRYRAELLRQMASFIDSEMAGAAGFADIVNDAPGVSARIAASRIVLEKFDHAGRILKMMGDFGANTKKYETLHPWNARERRADNFGPERMAGDMRLNVFRYPFAGWLDAVVMNVLMGRATVIQLRELARGSYQPLAEAFEGILPRERRHAELGLEGLNILVAEGNLSEVQASIDYWRPRISDSFGADNSIRFERLRSFGLRHRTNEDLRAEWHADIDARLETICI